MKKSKECFIKKYIYYAVKIQKAALKNDTITNNMYARKLNKLVIQYENEDYFSEALSELMDNDNLEIESDAASDSLRKNVNIDKAVRILEEISNKKDAGIIGFSSGIALKKWREKGAEGLK